MSVQIENISPLERKISVTIPAEKMRDLVDKRIKELTKTVKIPGFRPGKVPQKVVESRYGSDIFSEETQKKVQQSFEEAVTENKLNPASRPRIENFHASPSEGLKYDAIFDIFPEIQLADLSKIEIKRKKVQISEEDIDNTIDQLRKREADWHKVEKAAANGDKLFADVTLESGDMPPKDMQRLPVELGSKTMIAGFEDGLLGAKAGDEIILNLTFPDPYFDPKLSGQPAKFTVRVLEVLEQSPTTDETLLEKLGIEDGMDALRKEIRMHIEKEAEEGIQHDLKQTLWNNLLEIHSFDLPKSLIESELHRIIHPNEPNDDSHHHDNATPEQKTQAERQVRLGLLMSEFTTAHNISLDNDKVRAKIEKMVTAFQNPNEMTEYYYRNKHLLADIRARVLEDQVVDALLKQVKLVDQEISYKDLLKK